MIQASILIVNYRTPELLANCVASVKRHTTGSYELLIHDNSPPAPNLGFARANNILITRSKGEYIVLLNPDTTVTPRWLELLIETAQSEARIGVVQPKMLRPDGLIDSAGHGWTKQGLPYDRGSGEKDNGQYDTMTELRSCCFGCALVKRKVFQDVGLLDEKLFLFFEDVEFCLRARKHGWRIVYCPEGVVYHVRRGSGAVYGKFYVPYITLKLLGPWQYMKMIGSLLVGIPAGLKNSDLEYIKRKITQIRDALLV